MAKRHAPLALALGCVLGSGGAGRADTLTFEPLMDNTIYAESGTKSNGAGEFIFVGRNGSGGVRRGLLRFDLGVIPPGSVISNATLSMHVSRTQVGAQLVSLHRVLQGWGEGTSDASGSEAAGADTTPNDATWVYRHFNSQQWDTPGGSIISDATDSVVVDEADTSYEWAGSGIAGDVSLWVNNAAQNFGWELVGPENVRSTKRFNSRTHGSAETRPRLTVEFTPSTPIGGCCDASGVCAIRTPADCTSAGGTYRGNSEYCVPVPCPQPPAAKRPSDQSGSPEPAEGKNVNVNVKDVSVLLSQFGASVAPGTGADGNRDGLVDAADLGALLGRFGAGC